MIPRIRRIQKFLIAGILALGCSFAVSGSVMAQSDATLDSAKQAEARAAMEAAADSARRAAESRGARANRPQQQPAGTTTQPAAKDTTALNDETRAAAAQDVQIDTALKSIPDTGAAAATTTQTPDTAEAVDSSAVVQATPAAPKKPVDPTAPYKDVEFAPGEKPRVVIETAFGKIVLELYPDVAKKHCQNFVYQINEGFYDSLTFHRVVLGFLIQAGDPQGTGTGGPGYTLPAEFTTKHIHEEGTLSMARRVDPASKTGAAEKAEFLNSAGSQFFICTARAASLDGKYTIFGKVVEGLDVVHSIEKTVVQRERPVAPIYMTRVYVEPKA